MILSLLRLAILMALLSTCGASGQGRATGAAPRVLKGGLGYSFSMRAEDLKAAGFSSEPLNQDSPINVRIRWAPDEFFSLQSLNFIQDGRLESITGERGYAGERENRWDACAADARAVVASLEAKYPALKRDQRRDSDAQTRLCEGKRVSDQSMQGLGRCVAVGCERNRLDDVSLRVTYQDFDRMIESLVLLQQRQKEKDAARLNSQGLPASKL